MRALIMSELRQRVRGKRWWILLVVWALVLFGLLFMVRLAALSALRNTTFDEFGNPLNESLDVPIGPAMYGSLMLFTLILVCLVVPSLTSTSINGERDRGTLAVLQATMLRPWSIALAKFISAMAIAGVFLLATLPLILWCYLEGGVGIGRVLATYLILALVCAVLIAVGLTASTLVRRPALSAVISYGVVFALTLGTLIVFGLSLLSAPQEEVRVNVPSRRGRDFTTTQQVIGWRWVLLAPNPFVVLADAAPRSEERRLPDPLSSIREGVRSIRRPPSIDGFGGFAEVEEEEPPAVWPTGMLIEVALAAAAGYLTVSRLRIPARRLAPGQRVA